jgi:N-acetylmuramoyl-L-alanine amidase
VLDLDNAPAHSVYTLYNPFRIVIDFERPRAGVVPTAVVPRAAGAAPAPREAPVATPAVVEPARTVTSPPGTSADVPAAKVAAPRAPATSAPAVAPGRERPSPTPRLEPPIKTAGGFSVSRQLGLGIARVVIDPGHGGHDPGAKQDSLIESELVLDVALRLEQLLQKDDIEVVLTRRSNVYVPLEERPAIALREQADLYLSIHANASADRRVRGVETYILNFAPNAQSAEVAARENMGSTRTMRSLPDIVKSIALNNKIDESRDLAKQVQASLIEKLSKGNRTVRNLGVKQAPFAVLVGADMPSILAEIGFITNLQDAALVKTAVYRQQIAEAFAAGIARYQKRLKPSQVATTR